MTHQEKIEDCDLLIISCGSACELADLAHHVKLVGKYYSVDWQTFYNQLKNAIIIKAGIPDDEHEVLDEVIERLY